MPLLPPRPLPHRFNRRVSPVTRILARTHERKHPRIPFQWSSVVLRWRRAIPLYRKALQPLFILTSLMLFGGVLSLLLFSPLLTVREVRVTRMNLRLDIEEVQQALRPLIGRHLLMVSSTQVLHFLQERLPDVLMVEVQKHYPDALSVRITLEPLGARLNILDPDLPFMVGEGTGAVVSGIDFITEGGRYIASPAGGLEEGELSLLHLTDWGARPVPGEILLEPSFLQMMEQAEAALHDQFVQEVLERRIYLRAREFHLHTSSVALWFDVRSSLPQQLQRYRTFLKAVPPGEAHEYVDLRLSDRIAYR